MNNLEELEKKYEELGKEIERLKNSTEDWRAKEGEYYYYINDYENVECDTEDNSDVDVERYNLGNYFKTSEQAGETKKFLTIRNKLKKLAKKLNNGTKIDWKNDEQVKNFLRLGHTNEGEIKIEQDWNYTTKIAGIIYCLDDNFKEKAIEEIGEDDLNFYLMWEE